MNQTLTYKNIIVATLALFFIVVFCLILFGLSDSGILIGILLLFVLSFLLPFKGYKYPIIFSVCIFTVVKFINYFNLNPITGPDSQRYFEQTLTYQNLEQFMSFVSFQYNHYGFFDMSSYVDFGFLYLPFYWAFNLSEANGIMIFNFLLVLLTTLVFSFIVYNNFKKNISNEHLIIFTTLIIMMFFLSPTFNYWSSTFLKDIASIFTTVLSFYFFDKKRYILFVLAITYATMMRPYAIAIFFIYWLITRQKIKVGLLGSVFSFLVVFLIGGFTGTLNIIPTMLRILVNPTFTNILNWQLFFFPTIEGLIIALVTIIAALNFLFNKSTRRFYVVFALSLFIYSCVLTVVGHAAILASDLDYSILTAGDDFFRKKLPFMPVTFIMIAYTFITVFIKTKTAKEYRRT